MWGIDVSHTAHTGAQTGIQHVCRDILRCLAADNLAEPVIYDPYLCGWRSPDKREQGYIFPDNAFRPAGKRSSKWSEMQKLRGRFKFAVGIKPHPKPYDLLFCPELFDFRRDSSIFLSTWPSQIVRVAYFYDAIPVKFPEWTPEKTVSRYPEYLRTLARFDHVACISRASEMDLHAAWQDLEIEMRPPTSAISLGLPFNRTPDTDSKESQHPGARPVVLMVGTLEARKNHSAVLQACEELWLSGLEFELRLVGMLNRETGTTAAMKIEQLVRKGHPIHWEGAVSNDRLAEAYSEADIFLYPSLYEGFGLPVLEALAHGLPTITTSNGALAELVDGGGCLACEETSAGIAGSLRILLTDKTRRQSLSREARKRPIRGMRETCQELASLFQELTNKPKS